MVSLLSDTFYILIGLLVYKFIPHFNQILSQDIRSFLPIMAGALFLGALASFLYDKFFLGKTYNSSSYKALVYLSKKIKHLFGKGEQPELEYRHAFFLMFVKLFYIPLMFQFAYGNFLYLDNLLSHFGVIVSNEKLFSFNFFNYQLYPFLLSLCFFIDTVFYLFGYLIYSKALGNTIRSVESTWLGWLSALLCYPPLNYLLTEVLPAMQHEYPVMGSEVATFFLRFSMLILIIIYTLATVNLGWKCSNLTNRGIVSKGVYGVVRHPAYAAKNIFWLLSLLPIAFLKPQAIFYMAVWMFIYFLRAYTEERHLGQDPDYKAYCQKVKYRFIPKVI